RDLVFVDQRGTGGSNPLNCDFFNPSDLHSYFGFYFPLADVRQCREQLESKADLKLYTTHIAMDDLDEVRAALGYEQINISGGSYGTRAAQVYLKRHQSHVRTVVLQGVSPTNQLMPRDFPQHTERALNGVVEECAADDACRAAFPNLRAEVKAVLERLVRGPVAVDVKRPRTGVSTRVELSRDLAGEALRYMLYQSGAASRIPLFIHLAAQGNFTPLAESAIFYRQQIVATGSNGMYLSVTCAEDLPWIRPDEGERNAAHTFLGDYRLRQQRAACALWPRSEIPKGYAEPTRSDVPALILTGQWDPVTPPVYGDTAAKYLTNSLHLVVPHGGHGFNGLDGLDCIQNLIAGFVDRGMTKGLDTSCVNSIRRKGFLLKLAEPRKAP
ncbi:MAG: alpha/beta hydrolase, partial [Pyrinomonadaceae bacterium]